VRSRRVSGRTAVSRETVNVTRIEGWSSGDRTRFYVDSRDGSCSPFASRRRRQHTDAWRLGFFSKECEQSPIA